MIPAVWIPLAVAVLNIILEAQRAFNNAPQEYRDQHFQRLQRWEQFWDRLFEPMLKLGAEEKPKS